MFAELKVQQLPSQKPMLWLALVGRGQVYSQAGCCLELHGAWQEGGGTWQESSVWGALFVINTHVFCLLLL